MDNPLYLARHGETVWNRERRFQGRKDSPLTARGLEQAARVGRFLRTVEPGPAGWTIVTSPLGRARDTALIIGEAIGYRPERIEEDPRLMELDLSSWDGLTYDEIRALTPGALDGCSLAEVFFRCPGGESYEAFVARLTEWADDNAGREGLIVVAHGLVSRIMRGLHAGLGRDACLGLEIPQDAIYRLARGDVTRLDCPV